MMKRLYKIWFIQHGVEKEPKKWAGSNITTEYDKDKKTLAYPMVDIISVFSDRYKREDLVSMDKGHLEEVCEYFTSWKDSDQSYEVREDVGAYQRYVEIYGDVK